MFDPLLDDDSAGENLVTWWQALKGLEKAASVATVLVFLVSGLIWPITFDIGHHALGWNGLVGGTAFCMAAGLMFFKILGLLTGTDDIRWTNLLWWEVLLLIVLVNTVIVDITILSAA